MGFSNACGAQFRAVQDRQHDSQEVRVLVATRVYSADREDLWEALTDAERLPRWFLRISGELRIGGRYQLEGNAGGCILQCQPPEALDVTWEFGQNVSWVRVRLEAAEGGTRFTLEHLMPKDEASEEHWKNYGPSAAGVGWDLSFAGLALHLASDGEAIDQVESNAWLASDGGKAFMRSSADQWREAHVQAGEDPTVASEMVGRTVFFYTGE